jgi:hypothetical protein
LPKEAAVPGLTRRFALVALFVASPLAALGRARRGGYDAAPRGRIAVDVSELRRSGDNTDADYLAETLPGYLRDSVGPGHDIAVRVDSVTYGTPGSDGRRDGAGAVDNIEGFGTVDGRSTPVYSSIITEVTLPDVGGYAARIRQDMLARSFAQWLSRQTGL